jgi:hypothetical protein
MARSTSLLCALGALVAVAVVMYASQGYLQPVVDAVSAVSTRSSGANSVALFSLFAYHYEILLGFAEELSVLGYRVTVYARFANVSAAGDVQASSAAHVLKHHLGIPVVRDTAQFEASSEKRAVFISSQEECLIYPRVVLTILAALLPRVAYAVIHDARSPHAAGPQLMAAAHPRTVFLTLCPSCHTLFASWLDREHLSAFKHEWVLPVHWHQPVQPCDQATPSNCLRQFVVQGNLESKRRDYSRLLHAMQHQALGTKLNVTLLGKGSIAIPQELRDSVSIQLLLDYAVRPAWHAPTYALWPAVYGHRQSAAMTHASPQATVRLPHHCSRG